MVCCIGGDKMAVMARVLEAGRFSNCVSEKSGQQKLAALYIDRQFRDADEANLLDEEDMYVFDLKPLSDPLQLVCCNTCKKPVKASQYAAHAELCRSLVSTGEMFLEVEGASCPKKSRKKERKKVIAEENPAAERGQNNDACGAAPGSSPLDKRVQVASFSLVESGNGNGGKSAAKVDGGVPTGQGTSKSASNFRSTAKRPKLYVRITADVVQASSCTVTAQSVSKVISPAPLATKIYYSQRNDRLRAAINHMYHGSSRMALCQSKENMEAVEERKAACDGSFHSNPPCEQLHGKSDKGYRHSWVVRNFDTIASQNPEVCLERADPCQSSISYSKQFPVSDVLTSEEASPIEVIRSWHILKPHSFTGSSGNPMPVRKPSGSVPVA
ncbi:hypothetical protein Droror1_Dr00012600 [Drosera rotundifolia]